MSLPVHVLHVNFAKGFRGGERQTLNLMQGLLVHGITQSLVCRPGSELAERAAAAGMAIVPVKHPLMGHVTVPPASLIHVHEARAAYWAGLEALFRKTPYLITRRIPNPVSTGVATRSVYRYADAVVAVSMDVAHQLQQQINRQPQVIFDSCSAFTVDNMQLARIRQRCGTGPVIGHIGALQDHHKGQSVLIAAFHELVKRLPDARLLLVGGGPDQALFERMAQGDLRIIFAGFQSNIGAWLAAMDVFVFPSREEGLGSSVLDAMLLGVPVIASDVGGLPELIGRDERGWLVSGHDHLVWAQAIDRVLHSLPQHQDRLNAALKFAKENDIAGMTTQYLAKYRTISNSTAASA